MPFIFCNVQGSNKAWNNEDTLADHYKRHGKDASDESEEDYADKVNDFYKNKFRVKEGSDGTVRVYNPKTNRFGSCTKDGKIKRFISHLARRLFQSTIWF